ncbi:MAG: DUF2235 domain-containing protein, partial [Phenylobacterium sp.]|nr:DUF2235 domain-containing protein [Phenylobacterium sp.]
MPERKSAGRASAAGAAARRDTAHDRKRLAVFCDGTWNDLRMKNLTNVARLAKCVEPRGWDGRRQVVFYDSGVGVSTGVSRLADWLVVKLGGAIGAGLDDKIESAYRFLVLNYQPGDEIFVFGFSRGAYTARSLCGFLGVAGLLRHRDLGLLDDAFEYYRLPKAKREASRFGRIRDDLHLHTKEKCLSVRLLGVFDTVGALGVPLPWLKALTQWRSVQFHDTELSSLIENAYQALAIDERRGPFQPTLWTGAPGEARSCDGRMVPQRVVQAWFPGVHSDVGGGYDEKAYADVTLDWMLDVARSLGLVLREDYVERQLRPDHLASLHESYTTGWRLADRIPGFTRGGARPIGNEQRRARGRGPIAPTEVLHWTASARAAAAGARLPSGRSPYWPLNLCDGEGALHPTLAGLRHEKRRAARRPLDEVCTLDGRAAEL